MIRPWPCLGFCQSCPFEYNYHLPWLAPSLLTFSLSIHIHSSQNDYFCSRLSILSPRTTTTVLAVLPFLSLPPSSYPASMSCAMSPSSTYATSWPPSMLNAPKLRTVPLPPLSPVSPTLELPPALPTTTATHVGTSSAAVDEDRRLRAPKMQTIPLPDVDEPYWEPRQHTSRNASPRTRQSYAADAGYYPNALRLDLGCDGESIVLISPQTLPVPASASASCLCPQSCC